MTTNEPGSPEDTRPEGAGDDSAATAPALRRRLLLAGAATVLVAALVVALVVLGNEDDGGGSTGAGSSTSAEATDPGATASRGAPSEEPAEPTDSPGPVEPASVEELPPALPEVPLDASVAVEDGITALLPRIEAIEGVGQGPGNVSGPAVRITVRIENGTGRPVALDGVTVNMFYGSDSTPASPLEDASRQPFFGELPAGAAAEAVYVFSIPNDARDSVTVELSHRAGAPRVLFSGPVA